LSFLKALAARLGQLMAHHSWGLFLMSFLDSSFIPFPGINDLALIVMASQHPARGLAYALLSTVGSVLGCYVMYYIARGGEKLAEGRSTKNKNKYERARRWLERNDFVAMLVMSLLPPPAPLKLFVIAAGALRMNPLHFGAALLVGRSLRFLAEAWLGAHYGTRAEAYLNKNLAWSSLLTILVVIGMTLLWRRWKGHSVAAAADSGEPCEEVENQGPRT